jgi:hypothetical protein
MMPMTEIVSWTPCSDESMPDCDINVLLYSTKTGTVFEGFFDVDDDGLPLWRDVTAMPAEQVTHWAEMPTGPSTS